MDDARFELATTSKQEGRLNAKELELVDEALGDYGLHLDWFNAGMAGKKRAHHLNAFAQSLKQLADLYFRAGHLRLTTNVVDEEKSSLWYFGASSTGIGSG